MNLFELQERKDDLEADRKYYSRELLRLRLKVEPGAMDLTKDGSKPKSGSNDEALAELAQMSIYLDECIEKLDSVNLLINDKYNNFKKHNDYDKQIYTEKRLFKWSNAKISARHNGLSRTQIWNICHKIDNTEQK